MISVMSLWRCAEPEPAAGSKYTLKYQVETTYNASYSSRIAIDYVF